MGEPKQMLIVWGEGGGRRYDWQALCVDQWKKVTLDKQGNDRSRADPKVKWLASFVRTVLRMALADLANTKQEIQLNLNFRSTLDKLLAYVSIYTMQYL